MMVFCQECPMLRMPSEQLKTLRRYLGVKVEYANVSVVIPCYQCAKVVGRAVESVYAQTLRPLEVILIDDASPDKTLNELYRLQKLYQLGWIKVLSSEMNRGAGSTRNLGWQEARGSYVAFLDADDTWHPEKIRLQYGWMLANPDAVLSSHKTIVLPQEQDYQLDSKPSQVTAVEISSSRQLTRNYHATRTVMLRRDVPHRFEEGKRYSEDYLLWTSIMLSGGRAFLLNGPLAASYKNDFGDGGLSGHVWRMQKGNWLSYLSLYQARLISWYVLAVCLFFSSLRFLRRCLMIALRKLIKFDHTPQRRT